uniref:B-cell receptor CD22 n=1 Tax=Catagonus wagneri TaxID=51154 RepID=A0A8C3W680_9CETA
MHLLGSSLLLLVPEYLAFSDSVLWTVRHPKTLYAWNGACIWIPCSYTILGNGHTLDSLTVYHNYKYDSSTKDYKGTILYKNPKAKLFPSQMERVQFLGNDRNNCTLLINPVYVNDSGNLGLRMTSNTDKWLEPITLNVSERALPLLIWPPSEVRELQEVTFTCFLNFTCFAYKIHLQWSLEGRVDTVTSLNVESVSTQSRLTFKAQWIHHGKNLSCQLWDPTEQQVLSEATVQLDVKHPPQKVIAVIQNLAPIREGDRVTLYCTYNSSNPGVTHYNWNILGFRDQRQPAWLMIQKATWNAPPIQCAACNKWCSWSPSVNLDVHYAPKDVRVLISPPTEIHSGHRVLLQCDFSSSRPKEVHYFWKKNGILLKEGRELRFEAITPEDAGSYHCLVNNSVGQTTSPAWALRVLYAPRGLRVSIRPKDGVVEGKTAVLSCEGDANPPIFRYTWFDWNNQDIHHSDPTLKLDPVTVQHSGAYWCQGVNQLGSNRSPPNTLTVYYSSATISRRAAMGVGFFLAVLLLAIWGVKFRQTWKRIRSQQGFQENSNGQSFFVRNIKARRTPQAEGPHSMGCYNPVMEDTVSYAALSFPLSEINRQRLGGARNPEARGLSPNRDDTVTYSVVQRRQVGDYENVTPQVLEDEGIHYSELVHFGAGERPVAQEGVEYVTLKH